MRRARKASFTVMSVATALALAMAVPTDATATSHTGRTSAASVEYLAPQRVCAAPTAGHLACFAIRLVPVARGTRGARAVTEAPTTFHGETAHGYSPTDLARAYAYSRTAGGAGQTVGIVDGGDDPTIASDLVTFDSFYGLPAETARSFRKVNELGATSPLPAASDGATETALDVEAVRAVCQKCKILLVESNSMTISDLSAAERTAVRLKATEVSNSYGGPEGPFPKQFLKTYRAAYTHPGVVITAATGDDGWYSWDNVDGSQGKPAGALGRRTKCALVVSQVVSVGGTTLNVTTTGTRKSERVWNDNGPDDQTAAAAGHAEGASGGGCSRLFRATRWQAFAKGFHNTGCGKTRLAADVSAIGDYRTGLDVYDSTGSGGWTTLGGTSLSSPVVAAMWALAGGAHGVKVPSLSLYGHYVAKHTHLYDVTRGGNGFCDGDKASSCTANDALDPGVSPNELAFTTTQTSAGLLDCQYDGNGTPVTKFGQCVAKPGFDGASGVGTPVGLRAFKPLYPTAVPRVQRLTAGHQVRLGGKKSTDPFPGGSIAHYSWTFGDGTKGHGAKVSHSYSHAGRYTITLKVTDRYGQTSRRKKHVTVH